MRKSLKDIQHMVSDRPYKGVPEAWRPYEAYIADSGYCLCVVIRKFAEENPDGLPLWNFEVPLPAEYVLSRKEDVTEKDGYLLLDVPYDEKYGVMLPDGFGRF